MSEVLDAISVPTSQAGLAVSILEDGLILNDYVIERGKKRVIIPVNNQDKALTNLDGRVNDVMAVSYAFKTKTEMEKLKHEERLAKLEPAQLDIRIKKEGHKAPREGKKRLETILYILVGVSFFPVIILAFIPATRLLGISIILLSIGLGLYWNILSKQDMSGREDPYIFLILGNTFLIIAMGLLADYLGRNSYVPFDQLILVMIILVAIYFSISFIVTPFLYFRNVYSKDRSIEYIARRRDRPLPSKPARLTLGNILLLQIILLPIFLISTFVSSNLQWELNSDSILLEGFIWFFGLAFLLLIPTTFITLIIYLIRSALGLINRSFRSIVS